MLTYLPNEIVIHGIKVGLTYKGLHHMVKHYEIILSKATDKQLADKDRQHLIHIIERYKQHIELYENHAKHLINDPLGVKTEQPK
jgi:hypothetical protein